MQMNTISKLFVVVGEMAYNFFSSQHHTVAENTEGKNANTKISAEFSTKSN